MKEKKVNFIFRATMSVIVMAVTTYNSITNGLITDQTTDCIYDYSHILFSAFHTFFREQIFLKCFILFLTGLVLDSALIVLSLNWIFKGRSWRILVTILYFISLKLLTSFIFEVKYPEDTLFEYSGFPSLLVSYKLTNNLFFSSLIGLNFIFAVEMEDLSFDTDTKNNKTFYKIFSYILYVLIIVQFIIDLSIKSHYVVDEFTGLFTAHFCMISSEDLTRHLDIKYPLNNSDFSEDVVSTLSSKKIPIFYGSNREAMQIVNESYSENTKS